MTLGASGGTPPYHWSISGGALPSGLGVSGSTVSGTPTANGNFSFTVRVDDSAGKAAGVTRSITIAARLAASGPCTTRCNVEVGCVTVCGHFGSTSGGVTPFSYTLSGGTLPTGMGLSGLSLTGAFPPPPPAALFVPWKFAVTVTDAFGVAAGVTAVYYDYPQIAFTVNTATCTPTTVPLTCTTSQLQYTGGTPGSTPTVKVTAVKSTTGLLPPGFSAVASKGVVTVTVPGQKTNYSGTVTLILIDSDPCSTSGSCQSGPATVQIRV